MTHMVTDAGTTFTMGRGGATASPALLADVQRIFSDVTRYPVEILEADANIEEDLGIDSVKLGEIYAVLREKYNLPAMADLRGQLEPEHLRTIAGVANVVAQFSGSGGGNGVGLDDAGPTAAVPVTVLDTLVPPAALTAVITSISTEGLLDQVRTVFSEITRYPVEILEADANLEEDLGIDSVKLGEIFASLRERYGLPAMAELRESITPERMRTIGGITGVIAELVAAAAPPPSTAPVSAPAASNGASAQPTTAPAPRRASGALPKQRPERARHPFEGKIALVTGSGRGLGREVARHLADLGATVVVNSFHSREQGEKTAEEIKSGGGSAVHVWASVANDAQRDSLFDQIDSQFGALDFFVHCASNGTLAPIDKITSDDWDKAFRTNVVGLHQGAIRAAKLMQQRGGGKIVTLSMTATDRVFQYAACQSTVKAAIESLTRYLAVELAPRNIRVNCIKAGAIYGDVVNAWPETATLTPAWEQRAPAGRMCRPSDVCALLTALLSDDLEFMTGSTLVLDGGHSVRL